MHRGAIQKSDTVVVKGAGDLASGVAHCMHSVGFGVVMTETDHPQAVRRTVAFSEAIYDGHATVEGVSARRIDTAGESAEVIARGEIAVLIDPEARRVPALAPLVLIDAIIAKRNVGTRTQDAPIVIGLGPGFVAGVDVHAVIETNRGHNLSRIIWQGAAEPNTGVPGPVLGEAGARVLYALADGVVRWERRIGDLVSAGQTLASVAGAPLLAPFDGVLRGAIRDGITVRAGTKIGDVDPRGDVSACFTLSDKARAIGGAVLQALLMRLRDLQRAERA